MNIIRLARTDGRVFAVPVDNIAGIAPVKDENGIHVRAYLKYSLIETDTEQIAFIPVFESFDELLRRIEDARP